MSPNTIYLITGANRGIGHGLTATLLLRPSTTVIATIRSPTTPTDSLTSLPLGPSSKLIIAYLDLAQTSLEHSTQALHRTITSSPHQLTHIDVVICNAGLAAEFRPSLNTNLASMLAHFQTNTLGPISLFQTLYPLLAPESKFVVVSSSLGSIGAMEGKAPTLAYGVSKAGANYFVRKVHFEEGGVVALAVHPGWVKTGNGQAFADSIGVEAPPMELEESVRGVLEQVDAATKTTTSGCFVSYDGTILPW